MKKIIKDNVFYKIIAIFCCLFLLLIFLGLINIKNSVADTFHAKNVYFQIEDPNFPRYRITFKLISMQGNEYENNSLLVYFKCYDKNGIMVDDAVEAKIKKGEFDGGVMSYVGTSNSRYDEITYCELNYVTVFNR